MWDDVIIGEGNRLNSAVRVFLIKELDNVSENATSYWISDCVLDTGMTVFKGTPEGKQLTLLLHSKETTANQVQDYLDALILSRIDLERLKAALENHTEKMIELGQRMAKEKIRDALGI